MKTVYCGLTEKGLWIWFKSKTPVRNCKRASIITHENIKEYKVAPLFFQIFQFCLGRDYYRG